MCCFGGEKNIKVCSINYAETAEVFGILHKCNKNVQWG